jgi:hypothetical protein
MSNDLKPTPAEQKLIDAAKAGVVAELQSSDKTANDPATGVNWGPERTVRAAIVYALAVGTNPNWPVHARGVRLMGAKIVDALDFKAAKLPHPLALSSCYIEQRIDFEGASAHSIYLTGSHIVGMGADGLRTRYDVWLNAGFTARGEVSLLDAHIEGTLQCGGAIFDNSDGCALNADRLTVEGSLLLRNGFKATGEVRMPGAKIGGNLDCGQGTFENASGRTLAADGITIKGVAFLRDGFKSTGEVRLVSAHLCGSLECDGGTFTNPNGMALNAERLTIDRDVFLRDGFHATGEVRFLGANIGGSLQCSGATFDNADKMSLDLEGANIRHSLYLKSLAAPPTGTVDLSFARVGQLVDDPGSWPQGGAFRLQGFVYEALAGPADAKTRLEWLSRQRKTQFRPQPYEQLIRVLGEMGHDRDAQAIAVAKQAALRKSGELGALRRSWNLLLAVTVRYGYHPTLIIAWMAPIVVLGGWIFANAYHSCLIVPTKERIYLDRAYNCLEGAWILPPEYPRFHPIVYSLDVFFPVVDLRQKAYWEPSDTTEAGLVYRRYFWLHTVIGWLLTALAVAGLTRLVKRD